MFRPALDLAARARRAAEIDPLRVYGHINQVIGLTVESQGPPAAVGELLKVDDDRLGIPLQVVGFRGRSVLSMPLGELNGLSIGQKVYALGRQPGFRVGPELLGRVINGRGELLDGGPEVARPEELQIQRMPVNAMEREPIDEVLATGVRSIDAFNTLGKGQRIGIFSGSGVGKSTLMGMIARNTAAEVNVIALIGERGRELKDFIVNSLGEEGLKRSVVVAATSDEPPLVKIMAAFAATAVAEYFCDRGADVLLMMDSITRLAMAQREVGLSVGEPPSNKGYTPSVFTQMPKLLERAGNFAGKGSITGIYTVLVEGDDVTEPISDHARSILDGHVVLSRDLAHRNQFPAVDILGSISRLMSEIADADHKRAAGKVRELLAVYRDAEDLINIGAYQAGSNPRIDQAVARMEAIRTFLGQGVTEKSTFPQTRERLLALLA
ncbi:MAG TPA: FliI/YscN family ATPase [Candidatus Aminicenantes bacterium]|nr:FliI/YscN family ATPase [Candidatus Aminicenantes bacterium]